MTSKLKTKMKPKKKSLWAAKVLTPRERFLKDCKGHWVKIRTENIQKPRVGVVCSLTRMNGVKILFLDKKEPEIYYAPIRDVIGLGPAFTFYKAQLIKTPMCGDPKCTTCTVSSDFKEYELQ